jgi:NAD(P)-dependent dehydrogenase (short-subunit alcohol dehydrogenase family)
MFNASTNAGRVCFITGCTTPRSIGRASALLLARHGGKVVAADLPKMQGLGEELVAEIKKAGGEAVFVPLDVTKEDQWTSAMATWVFSGTT